MARGKWGSTGPEIFTIKELCRGARYGSVVSPVDHVRAEEVVRCDSTGTFQY